MGNLATSAVILAILFGGAMLGLRLREALPGHHLAEDSKNIALLGAGLVVTMSARVLGLLVNPAQSAFDTQRSELMQLSGKIVWIDRMLASYGPGGQHARDRLKVATGRALETVWGDGTSLGTSAAMGDLYAEIQALQPTTDVQRTAQATALAIANDIGQTRWLMFEQRQGRLPQALLVGLVAWLAGVFTAFGLFSPRNPTVVASLLISALSVTGAIFLSLEMYSPYGGLIQVTKEPLRVALEHLGR
jgi:hypothetical protein